MEADYLSKQGKDWWFGANRLKLNDEKTQTLLRYLKLDSLEKESVKLLGFWIDPKLSWNQLIAGYVKLSRVL